MHIRTMLRALDRLEQHGYAFGARRVDILATAERQALGDRIAESLAIATTPRSRSSTPTTRPGSLSDLGHRTGRFRGPADRWRRVRLAGQLAANRRAVFIATGTGAQLIAWRFRSDGAQQGH